MKARSHNPMCPRVPASLLWVLLAAYAQAQPPPAAPAASAPSMDRNFVIGADDSVTIVATKAEDLNKQWRVGASGYLNLPLVGRIQVAGMTAEQLETELQSRLKEYIVDPQVSVYLSEFRSMPVTVTGAVERPGVTQVQGAHGLFDVLMRAGGPKDAGEFVTVTRRLDRGRISHPAMHEVDGSSVVELPLGSVLEGRGPAADLPIQTGDVITVSNVKQQRLVYILGAVLKPGAVELVAQDKVSLLKLLAVAGGFTNIAARDSTYIRHAAQSDGKVETTTVNISKLLKGKAPDVDLAAGDMVVVPSSKLATYMQSVPQSAVTTGILMLARF